MSDLTDQQHLPPPERIFLSFSFFFFFYLFQTKNPGRIGNDRMETRNEFRTYFHRRSFITRPATFTGAPDGTRSANCRAFSVAVQLHRRPPHDKSRWLSILQLPPAISCQPNAAKRKLFRARSSTLWRLFSSEKCPSARFYDLSGPMTRRNPVNAARPLRNFTARARTLATPARLPRIANHTVYSPVGVFCSSYFAWLTLRDG